MSLSWSAVVGTAINMTVNTLGAVGTGDFTVVVLTKPAGNHGHVGFTVTTGHPYQQLNDSNIWFGGGDFSGFGTSNNTDWHVIGHSKISGANTYRWHYWNYSAGGAKTHAAGTGTHANPGTITAIKIGDCDNRGNGLIAVVAVWKRQLSDAEFDSLCTTHLSDWNALAPDALWPLNVAAASVVDVTGHGNNAASVTGTISAGADPPSFDYSLGSPVVIADPSNVGSGTGGQLDGLSLGDAPGWSGTGGTSDGRTLGDGPGGAGTGGTTDGRALGDAPGGGGGGDSGSGLALGDGPGGAGTGGQLDGLALGDVSGWSGTGGALDGRVLGDGSGWSGTGGSPDGISVGSGPVTITDSSGGGGTGGSPDVVTNTGVVRDTMVMPILTNAHTCLLTEMGKVPNPPAQVQIRPGSVFTAMADSTGDECCQGIAWVRAAGKVPTGGDWPNQLGSVQGPSASRGQPAYYAVQVELGIYRCIPVISNVEGANDGYPTGAQWLAAAQEHEDDSAALRRAVCCLRAIYGNDAVLEGPTQPMPNEGNCGGQLVVVTVRAPACDCVS
jgi:hypothetical protein